MAEGMALPDVDGVDPAIVPARLLPTGARGVERAVDCSVNDAGLAYELMSAGRCGKVAVCFDDELTGRPA
jgi:hypothetical protein